MKIIADSNLVLLNDTFARHGKVTRIPGREINPGHLHDADVLLVRSVTAVNRDLIKGSPVKFVGTATIGTDHIDTDWLNQQEIHWASAPGCNANATAQYSLAMIWLGCQRLGINIREKCVGIIGHGNVGSRLHILLDALGVSTLACDPPLARQGEAGLVSPAEALQQSIVSIHVPLTKSGPFPTWHMINPGSLEQMQNGALLVNTSRGDVTDGSALRSALQCGHMHAALDVWPGEPCIDTQLLDSCVVGSPHVAGYSVEGKQNGTMMIYQAYREWLGLAADRTPARQSPADTFEIKQDQDPVGQLLTHCCKVATDDKAFRQSPSDFDKLRMNYRLRHDFGGWQVRAARAEDKPLINRLGFQ